MQLFEIFTPVLSYLYMFALALGKWAIMPFNDVLDGGAVTVGNPFTQETFTLKFFDLGRVGDIIERLFESFGLSGDLPVLVFVLSFSFSLMIVIWIIRTVVE